MTRTGMLPSTILQLVHSELIAKMRLISHRSTINLELSGGQGHAGKQPERRLSGLDRFRGMLRHPPFAICAQCLPIGRGTKALNPGGVGAKPPQASVADADCLLKQGALS